MGRKLKARDVEVLDVAPDVLPDADDEDESDLPELGSYERIGLARKIAHAFLDDAASPEDRKERLEKLREELPRRDRRQLRIPSPDKAPSPKPVREKAPALRECPRCHERVPDLGAHKDVCPKKAKTRRWELAGPPATAPIPWTEAEIADEIAPWTEGAPWPVPDEPAAEAPVTEDNFATKVVERMDDKAFELVERCLLLADVLWAGEDRHEFVVAPKRGSHDGWLCATVRRHGEDSIRGSGPTMGAAVRALADALRVEAVSRMASVATLSKLLED